MNPYLTELLDIIGIDIPHLNSYLSIEELSYLGSIFKSASDFERDFYTNKEGEHLEVLLHFLNAHKKDIIDLIQDSSKTEIREKKLYTSSAISADYDCFRFDLSKFPQTYKPKKQVLVLYRIGRKGECTGNLGCSWSRSLVGLEAYCRSSAMTKTELDSRPVFSLEIDDSEVLFEGSSYEQELVLQAGFNYNSLKFLDKKSRNQILEY